jgi:RHS repeat-associated protein
MSIEGGVTKFFAWAGGRIIAEYEASGANALVWKTSYVYLGGRLLATTSGAGGTETRFHHPDRLGTRLVTDAGGTVVSEQWTLPFGNMQPFTSVPGGENPYQHPTLGNPSKKRFTSYDRSEATGLDYAVNRFYSPQQGRFTQVDPIEMGAASLSAPQTLNMYAYCGNDPINHVDPAGLLPSIDSPIQIVGGWGGAVVSVIIRVISGGRIGPAPTGGRTPPINPGSPPSISLGDLLGNIPLGIRVKVDPRTPPLVRGFNDSSVGGVGDVRNCGGPGEPQCPPGTTLHVVTLEESLETQRREYEKLEERFKWLLKKQDQLLTINSNPNQEVLEMGIPWGALARMLLGRGANVGRAADRMVTVSRWGRPGLQSGDWVMKGGVNRWNYFWSGKWQPGMGNQYAPYRSGMQFEVPASSVKWPTGWGVDGGIKGIFGQRLYIP